MLLLDSQSKLRQLVLQRMRDYFPMLVDSVENKEELKSMFDPKDWEYLQQDLCEREEAKQRMAYLKGTVLEKETFTVSELSDFYPVEALRQGVEWPSNVDPANRERHLSDDDFKKVFKMTKEQYHALPQFRRIRLKKENHLF